MQNKVALPIPITTACALFTGSKVNLRHGPAPERDVLRDAYFIAANWRLLGEQIVQRRKSPESQLVLLNAVYVGAGRPLEAILDDRQVAKAHQREPLPQTTVRGDECGVEPEATIEAFTSCLRFTTRITPTATDLNPAAPWQIELYASDLQFYEAVSDAYRQRAATPSLEVDMELQSDRKNSKDFEFGGVAWRYNEIWYGICVAECVFSTSPADLFGYEHLGFDPDVHYDESLSEESEADADPAAKETPGNGKITTSSQGKNPVG